MSVVKTVQEESLVALGNAIRAKAKTSEPLEFPTGMVEAIEGITTGGGEVEPIVLTGNCSYVCSGPVASAYIEANGDTITTKDISDASNMFYKYVNECVPFDLHLYPTTKLSSLFSECHNLTSLPPAIINCKPSEMSSIFAYCWKLREIPEDYFDDWDFSYIDTLTSGYSGGMHRMFDDCFSLRTAPMKLLAHGNPKANYNYTYFYQGFSGCYGLDELVNLPIPYTATYTSNLFNETVNSASRLKNFTFAMPNGEPYVMNWKNQTLRLDAATGWNSSTNPVMFLNYNAGLTADKEVKDDATYQSLKNDPDWFTCNVAYSRYNHDSAVATINSLPDTSAYLASAGGTNTIKFKGAAGALTDGGAINTLTAEEIAVATAKGWTVSLV